MNAPATKNQTSDSERAADAALVSRAQSGDQKAFELLVRSHQEGLYRVVFRYLKNEADALDVTQRALVKAYKSLDKFRGDAAFSTWLHRLAVNVVLGERRSAQRRELREQRAAGVTEIGPPQAQVDAGVDLDKAIAALPERARMVFVLHAIEGYAHAEIAKVMGSSVGTTKAQLHRARALLREALS